MIIIGDVFTMEFRFRNFLYLCSKIIYVSKNEYVHTYTHTHMHIKTHILLLLFIFVYGIEQKVKNLNFLNLFSLKFLKRHRQII